MQPFVYHTGDDKPDISFRVLDQDNGCYQDLSGSGIAVIARFRLRNVATTLQAIRCTKVGSGLDGLVTMVWPTDALDVAAGRYEIEVSVHNSSSTGTITAATAANPVSITSSTHGLSTGDEVHIDSVVGMTELNDAVYTITKVDADTFTLDSTDGSAYTAYSSAGTWTEIDGTQTGNRYYKTGVANDDDNTLPIKLIAKFA